MTTIVQNHRPPRPVTQLNSFTRKEAPPDESLLSEAEAREVGREGRLGGPGEGSRINPTRNREIWQANLQMFGIPGVLGGLAANDVVLEPVGDLFQGPEHSPYAAAILLRITPRDDGTKPSPLQAALFSVRPKIGQVLLRLVKWVMALEWQDAELDVRIARVGVDGILRATRTAKGNLASWYTCLGEICEEEIARNLRWLTSRVRHSDPETLRYLVDTVVMEAFEALEVGRLDLDGFAKTLTFAGWDVIDLLRKSSRGAPPTESWESFVHAEAEDSDLEEGLTLSSPEADLLAAEAEAGRTARVVWLLKELRDLQRSSKAWVRDTATYLLRCTEVLKLPSVQELAELRGVHVSVARRQLAQVCQLLLRRLRR